MPEAWERRKVKGHQLEITRTCRGRCSPVQGHRRYSPTPTIGRTASGDAYKGVKVDLDLSWVTAAATPTEDSCS